MISSDDPYCDSTRAMQMVHDWGAQLHVLGAFGHINAESGLGDWPEGRQLLLDLAESADGRNGSRTIRTW